MPAGPPISFTAFDRHRRIAGGALGDVARAVKIALDRGAQGPITVLDDATARPIEVDFRGTADEVVARITANVAAAGEQAPRGPGRPKLGVVSREVTLLPRHWEWLGLQPGGASAALRRLVEQASRQDGPRARAREAIEAVDRFMLAMTGDFPRYEEASRAFYRGDREGFASLTAEWPVDVRDYLLRLAETAWQAQASA